MIDYASEVRSSLLRVPNGAGRRIVAVAGEPPGRLSRGTVLLVPGYQQRIHHLGLLSRSLVRRGYRTVRFDLTNHVGASDGDVLDLTMSSMTADVTAMIAGCAFAGEPLHVVATSLGARAAVRALATGCAHPVSTPVLVLPVVDVEYTINTAAERNVFADWRSGRETDPAASHRVLDHQVRYEFVRDAIEHGFVGVDATTTEIAGIGADVHAIAAERDDWVITADVEAAMGAAADAVRRTVVLSATSHELANNPPVMRLLLEQIVDALSPQQSGDVPHLSFDEIVDTVNNERNWARRSYADLAGEERAS